VAGAVGEAAGLGVAEQLHAEFGAGGFEGIDVADLGEDGGEVGHGGVLGFGLVGWLGSEKDCQQGRDAGPTPVGWVGFCQGCSTGELQLPPAHLAEALDEFAGILAGQFRAWSRSWVRPVSRLRVAVRLLR
jgi:hypothetical protein